MVVTYAIFLKQDNSILDNYTVYHRDKMLMKFDIDRDYAWHWKIAKIT